MDLANAVGFIAAALTTGAFLPQAIKTLRERQTRDISLPMYVLFCTGVCLWLIYGILIQEYPIIVANALTLLLATTVLLCKIRYG